MSRADAIEQEAAEWLVKLDKEETPELHVKHQEWCSTSPRNKAAYLRLRKAWHRMDRLKTLRPIDGTVDEDLLESGRFPD